MNKKFDTKRATLNRLINLTMFGTKRRNKIQKLKTTLGTNRPALNRLNKSYKFEIWVRKKEKKNQVWENEQKLIRIVQPSTIWVRKDQIKYRIKNYLYHLGYEKTK